MERALLALASALALSACSSSANHAKPDEPDDVGYVTDGSDTAAAETDAQLITSSLVASSSPDALGLENAATIYLPQRCLEIEDDPAAKTAKYTFTNCMGPNGLRGVTGVVETRYEVQPSGLHLELTATDVSVNRAKISWAATADIVSTAGGAGRTMTWKATLSGVSAGGRTLERTTAHTISWRLGEPCFSLDGTSEGRVDRRSIRTDIQGFRRCRRACPDAGGKIIVTNVDANEAFELVYDGTNRATFVEPDGKTVPVPLQCGP